MSLLRRSGIVVLTLLLVAVFSAFAWSDETTPRSFHVAVSGRGRPMILIPGLASSGDTWTSTVARYDDRYECHVLTLAGFAGQPSIAEPLIATVRKDLVDHPDLFGPLVIVDSVPFLGGSALGANSIDEAKPRIAAMRAGMSGLTDEQWAASAKSGASVKYMVTAPSDLATLIKWSASSDRRTVTDALADVYGLDLREDVARITAPVLALGTWRGIHDQVQASAEIDISREAFMHVFSAQFVKLPRLHFVLAETSRHFIMFDDPSWFFGELDSFLKDPDAAVRARGFDGK